jgi:hypothetical protein
MTWYSTKLIKFVQNNQTIHDRELHTQCSSGSGFLKRPQKYLGSKVKTKKEIAPNLCGLLRIYKHYSDKSNKS